MLATLIFCQTALFYIPEMIQIYRECSKSFKFIAAIDTLLLLALQKSE